MIYWKQKKSSGKEGHAPKQLDRNPQYQHYHRGNNNNIVDAYLRPTGSPYRYSENIWQNRNWGFRPYGVAHPKQHRVNHQRVNQQVVARRPYITVQPSAQLVAQTQIPTSKKPIRNRVPRVQEEQWQWHLIQ